MAGCARIEVGCGRDVRVPCRAVSTQIGGPTRPKYERTADVPSAGLSAGERADRHTVSACQVSGDLMAIIRGR